MALKTCVQCGSSVDDAWKFCPSCGAGVPGATPSMPGENQTRDSSRSDQETKSADLPNNVAGLLCYILLFVTGILFLVIEPYNKDKFVRFHAFQSIFFFIAWVVVQVVASVIGLIISAVLPPPIDFMSQIFQSLVTLGLLFVWIFLMYKAYSKEMFSLPIIGDLAARQA